MRLPADFEKWVKTINDGIRWDEESNQYLDTYYDNSAGYMRPLEDHELTGLMLGFLTEKEPNICFDVNFCEGDDPEHCVKYWDFPKDRYIEIGTGSSVFEALQEAVTAVCGEGK